MLGIRNEEKGTGAALHSNKFDLDEDALKNGIRAIVSYTVAYLNSNIVLEGGPYKNNLRALFREEDRSDAEIEDIYNSII